MLKLILLLGLSVASVSAQFIAYDADRRVPWFDNPVLKRNEFDWWAANTGQPSILYSNGIAISSESGTNDVRLAAARALNPSAASLPIGIVDQNNAHGYRVSNVLWRVCGNAAQLWGSVRLDAADIAAGISNFVNTGKRLIVVPAGSGNHLGTSNACRLAERSNVLVFCSMANTPGSSDINPDYPYFWAGSNKAIIGVTMTGRDGELVAGATAWGTNSFAAPGKNIITIIPNNFTNYSSGNSFSAPMLAGMMALLMSAHPNQTLPAYREALFEAITPITNSQRVDALSLITAPSCFLVAHPDRIALHGLSQWRYTIERSFDLVNWGDYTNVLGTASFQPAAGFFRAAFSPQPNNGYFGEEAFGVNTGYNPSDFDRDELPAIFGGSR